MVRIFTRDELLRFNEILLGRGVPVHDDGIGYNKGDYGACVTYFHGLSDAQYADLAKRLIKYSNTQLLIDKESMEATARDLAKIANPKDRDKGISLNVTRNGTLFSFRYNTQFIDVIKKQPKRRWDAENKNWIIPNSNVIKALKDLETVGADVENALTYASNHELIKNTKNELTEIVVKPDGDFIFLKFDYNKEIVDEIKQIDKKERQWNADFKFWAIHKNYFQTLQDKLSGVAKFKNI